MRPHQNTKESKHSPQPGCVLRDALEGEVARVDLLVQAQGAQDTELLGAVGARVGPLVGVGALVHNNLT